MLAAAIIEFAVRQPRKFTELLSKPMAEIVAIYLKRIIWELPTKPPFSMPSVVIASDDISVEVEFGRSP